MLAVSTPCAVPAPDDLNHRASFHATALIPRWLATFRHLRCALVRLRVSVRCSRALSRRYRTHDNGHWLDIRCRARRRRRDDDYHYDGGRQFWSKNIADVGRRTDGGW